MYFLYMHVQNVVKCFQIILIPNSSLIISCYFKSLRLLEFFYYFTPRIELKQLEHRLDLFFKLCFNFFYSSCNVLIYILSLILGYALICFSLFTFRVDMEVCKLPQPDDQFLPSNFEDHHYKRTLACFNFCFVCNSYITDVDQLPFNVFFVHVSGEEAQSASVTTLFYCLKHNARNVCRKF